MWNRTSSKQLTYYWGKIFPNYNVWGRTCWWYGYAKGVKNQKQIGRCSSRLLFLGLWWSSKLMKVVEKAHYTLEPRYSLRIHPEVGPFSQLIMFTTTHLRKVVEEGLRDSHEVIMFLLYGKALAENEFVCRFFMQGLPVQIFWWKIRTNQLILEAGLHEVISIRQHLHKSWR